MLDDIFSVHKVKNKTKKLKWDAAINVSCITNCNYLSMRKRPFDVFWRTLSNVIFKGNQQLIICKTRIANAASRRVFRCFLLKEQIIIIVYTSQTSSKGSCWVTSNVSVPVFRSRFHNINTECWNVSIWKYSGTIYLAVLNHMDEVHHVSFSVITFREVKLRNNTFHK